MDDYKMDEYNNSEGFILDIKILIVIPKSIEFI